MPLLSLFRQTHHVESDYLNGEIVLQSNSKSNKLSSSMSFLNDAR